MYYLLHLLDTLTGERNLPNLSTRPGMQFGIGSERGSVTLGVARLAQECSLVRVVRVVAWHWV